MDRIASVGGLGLSYGRPKIYGLGFDPHGVQRSGANTARRLAGRSPQGLDTRHYKSWLRHALTMAARENILDEERNAGLIARAHNVVREVAALHQDVDGDSEEVLDSLCQFDALGALVITSELGNPSGYYPSFSRYDSHRTEPAFVALIRDREVREAVFPHEDDSLAAAIRHIDGAARRKGFKYDRWDGLEDPIIRQFLAEHPEP